MNLSQHEPSTPTTPARSQLHSSASTPMTNKDAADVVNQLKYKIKRNEQRARSNHRADDGTSAASTPLDRPAGREGAGSVEALASAAEHDNEHSTRRRRSKKTQKDGLREDDGTGRKKKTQGDGLREDRDTGRKKKTQDDELREYDDTARKKKTQGDGLREDEHTGSRHRHQPPPQQKQYPPLTLPPPKPDFTSVQHQSRQEPLADRPRAHDGQQHNQPEDSTSEDEDSESGIAINEIKSWCSFMGRALSLLVRGAVWTLCGIGMAVSAIARKCREWWNCSGGSHIETTPPGVEDGRIAKKQKGVKAEKTARLLLLEASPLPPLPPAPLPPPPPPRELDRKETPPSDRLQHQETALDPPRSHQEPSSSRGQRTCQSPRLRRFAWRLGQVLFVALLVWIFWIFSTQTLPSTYDPHRPLDDLVDATHITATALEKLVNTATERAKTRLFACQMIESSAEIYRRPRKHPEFTLPWAEADGHLGWGCPMPDWLRGSSSGRRKRVKRPKSPPDEELGRLGVQLAGELWNMTLLLHRSHTESLVAAQGAAHLASQIEEQVRQLGLCRHSDPWWLRRVRPAFLAGTPPDSTSLLILNSKISQLNSSLSTFTASHSSRITDLEVSATLCLHRLGAWQKASRDRKRPKIKRRDDLRREIEAVCQKFDRRTSDNKPGSKEGEMEDTWDSGKMEQEEMEARLPPFALAKKRLDEASKVLANIPASSRRSSNSNSNTSPAFSWISPIASGTRHPRCGILGAPGVMEEEENETLLGIWRRMVELAVKAGTLVHLGPKDRAPGVGGGAG
ncbi:unnamed protein product [Zymoseptoria tritici ST99CH_1A5]|uniref:Uncharacterized protein n=1 Tax=Zymoseptoria tritici ST99CH_1A5 TaxID=1276529 RepID=A0A1Y6M3G1_ZYMTR|nr:unnamed protein product [Zymoseptoria tritici ST99CH_1A5]